MTAMWLANRVFVALVLVSSVFATAADFYWNGTDNNYNSLNWENPPGTPLASWPGSWDRIYNTAGGKVTLSALQRPGYFQFASGELEILAGGTLEPQGNGGGAIGDGSATITINGGTLRSGGPAGATVGEAAVNLRSGTWTLTGGTGAAFYAAGGSATPARISHTGGTLASNGYSVIVGQQNQWGDRDGDYYFGDAAGSSGALTGSGSLIVGNITAKMSGSGYRRTTYGTFTGHGTVGLTGTLRNNGYVIANGYGADRDLDLTAFTAVTNTIDNNEYKLSADNNFYYGKGGTGWFAVDGGRLVLPAISVAAGAGAYNWGENPADTDIDLVNSLRIAFTDVAAPGNLSASLLATDRGELARTAGNLLAVWDLSAAGLQFGTADIVFRYDDALATSLGLTETALRLYHLDGNAWVDVTSGVDLSKKQISAAGIGAFSLFAIGTDVVVIPEPASALILALAGVSLAGRRRRG
ncbi:MAG: hypothetical protein BWZ02_00247 [Lentisphaerae bacterium ADurb.BinA184]|nr:MAG: hypothetical protein BWZ02_00247 [Lentisphaerae bacterium ADurb.BinA184]